MKELTVALFAIIGVLAAAVGIGLLLAYPIKWCWNYTMPELFGLSTITWGQAWCLALLSHVFFKSHDTGSKKD